MLLQRLLKAATINLLSLLAIIQLVLIIDSCKKENHKKNADTGYKISVEKGSGQTDTIGNTLNEEVVFKSTFNGDTLLNGYVRIELKDCDNNTYGEEFRIGRKPRSIYPLLLPYKWTLNGMVGKQEIKAILMDSLHNVMDSVVASAEAVSPNKGWYRSGCMPTDKFCVTFCKLPNGRLFTALNQEDYPYFSDDEGASWHRLTVFPGKYAITKMISTSLNEVFAGIKNKGMFYSKDGGEHWEERNNGLPEMELFWGEILYTNTEKLFVLTGEGVFTSSDKGLHWHQAMQGLNYYAGFWDVASMSDGTLYAIHDWHVVFSTDGGESWRDLYTLSSTARCTMLFIDENDDIYVATSKDTQYGLCVSKDKGNTWGLVYIPEGPLGIDKKLSAMSKQNSYYYFYSTEKNVLIRTADFITYTSITPPPGNNYSRFSYRYIATDNNIVLSTESYGIYYFKY